jgi:DNA-binding MarR family transcriptional regulator
MAGGALPFDPVGEARRQWQDHGWDDAAVGMSVVTSIMRVQQILIAQIDGILAPWELTLARFEVLRLLDFTRHKELPLGKIGTRLQVHPTSVTNAIDRLEQQGLVERVAHPTDRRTTLATITAEGRRVVKRATRELNEKVFTELPLDDRQLTSLYASLERIRRAAGDFD